MKLNAQQRLPVQRQSNVRAKQQWFQSSKRWRGEGIAAVFQAWCTVRTGRLKSALRGKLCANRDRIKRPDSTRLCSPFCYCTYPLLEGKHLRNRSVEAVIAEFEQLQRAGARYVSIINSVFNSSSLQPVGAR